VCNFADAFVPCTRVRLPEPVRGLFLRDDGEVHRDFARHFAKEKGTLLCFDSGGQCMCGFNDWPAMYDVGRGLLAANEVPWVALFFFWSSDRYTPDVRIVDPEDADALAPLVPGEIVVLRPLPTERRRHRSVVRALELAVGTTVTLRLKGGGVRHGMLGTFDGESEVGTIGDTVVVAGQVLGVEPDTK